MLEERQGFLGREDPGAVGRVRRAIAHATEDDGGDFKAGFTQATRDVLDDGKEMGGGGVVPVVFHLDDLGG